VAFDLLLKQVSFGNREPDIASSIASRLARLDKQISKADREELQEAAGGRSLQNITHALVEALDPDVQYVEAEKNVGGEPTSEQVAEAARSLLDDALEPLATNPALREKLVEIRRSYEQTIDEVSKDEVIEAGYSPEATEKAKSLVASFRQFIEDNKDEITALQILYNRPYVQRLTFKEIKELAHAIERPPRAWTPDKLWKAYEALEKSKVRGSGQRTLTDLVSLVRHALEPEGELIPFRDLVEERFATWLLQQGQAGRSFTAEQQQWLERIKDHIASSLAIQPEDFDYTPFIEHGGLGRAHAVFGDQLNPLLDELTAALAA
jgi:type I restriction enzyme R subunit